MKDDKFKYPQSVSRDAYLSQLGQFQGAAAKVLGLMNTTDDLIAQDSKIVNDMMIYGMRHLHTDEYPPVPGAFTFSLMSLLVASCAVFASAGEEKAALANVISMLQEMHDEMQVHKIDISPFEKYGIDPSSQDPIGDLLRKMAADGQS